MQLYVNKPLYSILLVFSYILAAIFIFKNYFKIAILKSLKLLFINYLLL